MFFFDIWASSLEDRKIMDLKYIHTFVKGAGYKWSSAFKSLAKFISFHRMFDFIESLDGSDCLHDLELLYSHFSLGSFLLSSFKRWVRWGCLRPSVDGLHTLTLRIVLLVRLTDHMLLRREINSLFLFWDFLNIRVLFLTKCRQTWFWDRAFEHWWVKSFRFLKLAILPLREVLYVLNFESSC